MSKPMPMTTEKTRFLQHLDKFENNAKRAPAFQSLRKAARTRVFDLSFPTPKTEDWRFTNIAALVKVPFELASNVPIDGRALPALPTPGTKRLVFVNGVFAPELGSKSMGLGGIEVGSLGAVGAEQAARLKEVLGSADYKGQAFTALNTAFLLDGAYIVVPEGKVVEEPIEVVYLSVSAGTATVTHPRTVLIAGKGSQVTVLERYLGHPDTAVAGAGGYFTNAVTEIALSENAVVDHYKVQYESREAYHIANTQIVQARGSHFTTHYLSFGGDLVRNEVRVRFDGEGCEATVNGLYLASGKQHVDNFTVIDHAKPHCNSHELYKGILNDQAHGVFNGKIFVRPDAQKTDAKQTNKVLLLSDGATINTKPQLEIFADDVKCTHGATVGQLDAESIFYLRSRGIGLDEARALLTYAFANDIIGRIKIESLRDWLENLVMQR
jgi:Fe-S cluster assembly protein SufD